MRKINTLRFRLWLSLPVLFFYLIVSGQQQVIGSFPNMNGGFEGSTGSVTGTTASMSSWWLQLPTNNTVSIVSGTGARTGNNYLNAIQTAAATVRRIHSPMSLNTMASGTTFTVQFFYKGDKDGTPDATQTMSAGMYNNFSTAETKFQTWMNPNESDWKKNVFTLGTPFINTAQIYGIIRLNNNCTFDFDDFVIYEGTEDTNAPLAATSLKLSPKTDKVSLEWNAPSGGVDGGGYMVVRYLTEPVSPPDPNVNGIYAIGNSVGVGTVVYIGTDNYFVNSGLSSATNYFYRVYVVDKAFNYSPALSGSATTTRILTSVGNGNWESTSTWNGGIVPTTIDSVVISSGHAITVTSISQVSYGVAVQPDASLTINNGASLLTNILCMNNGTIVNDGTFLNRGAFTNNGSFSNASGGATYVNVSDVNGTGTLINNGTFSVTQAVSQQYLPSARNWYISSPVTAAKAKTGYTFYSRDETMATGTDGWVTMTTGDGTTTGDALTPGKGYIANLASGTATYSFAGTLNNGNVDVAVTRTGATAQSGFNLVGNPYLSYINWDNATLTNVKTTIWQRSNSGSAYVFDTYNSSGNVAVDLSGNRTNGNIAPMQAFWVQVADGQPSGTVGFTNSMRAHKGSKAITGGTVNDPIFKVGASATAQRAMIRLQVSNGINTDETVLYQNDNALNNVDRYDSPKMSNSNAAIPEIYSLVNGNKLTINGVNSIEENTELALGFVTGQANSFSLKVSQLSNMEAGLQVVLKDKVTGAQQVMTEGSVYSFTSDATAASDRFSVLFRSASSTTGVTEIGAKNKFGVYVNESGAIVVDLFNENATGSASVYNITGSKVGSQLLKASKSVLGMKAASGIYMVKVSNGTLTETHRVIVK